MNGGSKPDSSCLRVLKERRGVDCPVSEGQVLVIHSCGNYSFDGWRSYGKYNSGVELLRDRLELVEMQTRKMNE